MRTFYYSSSLFLHVRLPLLQVMLLRLLRLLQLLYTPWLPLHLLLLLHER